MSGAVRHRSGRMFVNISPGFWRCESRTSPAIDADVVAWELERRRSEPGAPAGWYVFGPGTGGVRAGADLDDAMELVVSLSDRLPRVDR